MNKRIPRICVSLAEKNIDDLIKKITELRGKVDWIELRLDYLERIKLEDIDLLSNVSKDFSTIVTIRYLEDGGKYSGTQDELIEVLDRVFESEFKFVDIDINQKDLLKEYIGDYADRIIISTHNFLKTPNKEEVELILKNMLRWKSKLIKIAYTANNVFDIDLMKKLILEIGVDKGIIIAMGEIAKDTRIQFPLIGSFLTFVGFGETKTAPGQYDLLEMQKIYREKYNLNF